MASNEADGTEFTLLGSYLLQDAQKLLERLDRAGIAFRTTYNAVSSARAVYDISD